MCQLQQAQADYGCWGLVSADPLQWTVVDVLVLLALAAATDDMCHAMAGSLLYSFATSVERNMPIIIQHVETSLGAIPVIQTLGGYRKLIPEVKAALDQIAFSQKGRILANNDNGNIKWQMSSAGATSSLCFGSLGSRQGMNVMNGWM